MMCPACGGEGIWWVGYGGNEEEMACERCEGLGEVEYEDDDSAIN